MIDSSEDLWTPRPVAFPVLAVEQPVLLASVRISAERKPAETQHTSPFTRWTIICQRATCFKRLKPTLLPRRLLPLSTSAALPNDTHYTTSAHVSMKSVGIKATLASSLCYFQLFYGSQPVVDWTTDQRRPIQHSSWQHILSPIMQHSSITAVSTAGNMSSLKRWPSGNTEIININVIIIVNITTTTSIIIITSAVVQRKHSDAILLSNYTVLHN